jgi:hypothetical protein
MAVAEGSIPPGATHMMHAADPTSMGRRWRPLGRYPLEFKTED